MPEGIKLNVLSISLFMTLGCKRINYPKDFQLGEVIYIIYAYYFIVVKKKKNIFVSPFLFFREALVKRH